MMLGTKDPNAPCSGSGFDDSVIRMPAIKDGGGDGELRAPKYQLKTKILCGVISLTIFAVLIALIVELAALSGKTTRSGWTTQAAAYLQTFSAAKGEPIRIGVPVKESDMKDHQVLNKKCDVSVISSESEWAEDQAQKLGIEFSYGLFSGSNTFSRLRNERLNSASKQYLATAEIKAVFKQFEVTPSMMQNDPQFSNLLVDLGKLTPSSSQAEFNAFYSKYG
eukprot:CAMPEP_0203789486 /NCGR_PEP_ID=MMETSP0100_2-20121128/3474_1 /ASSEMBLY_ACC=CAM_ASM_000210 /TAXON_ID=96639 /ORGANISM=" , Strain NY0313808BC1" /LENGTH=221 /DNA_ID=CAMNT_0050692435 /DNA_START=21 /DNA_END=683 /DNA_ORIENTATION=-